MNVMLQADISGFYMFFIVQNSTYCFMVVCSLGGHSLVETLFWRWLPLMAFDQSCSTGLQPVMAQMFRGCKFLETRLSGTCKVYTGVSHGYGLL